MHDATSRPKRMRYSYETRCRAVDAMLGGMSPAEAASSVGASRATGYRWLRRYRTGGWAGLRERPSTPRHQPRRLTPAEEAEIVAARERSGAGPLTLGALLGRPASDHREGAAAAGPLTAAARAQAARGALRA